jgi:hypothetical protein
MVVSGNNFIPDQWHQDRDCLWIQDVPVVGNNRSDEHQPEARQPPAPRATTTTPPLTRLHSFLADLLHNPLHATFLQGRLDGLFAGLDGSVLHHVRFVYSFPRPGRSDANRGGWRQLAQEVKSLRVQHELDGVADVNKDDDDDDVHLYAMSGSMGDLKPDFLRQMRRSMQGCRPTDKAPGATVDWSEIQHTYCLWPSRETALTMNPAALMGRSRALSKRHWKDNIPQDAKERLFFDALPHPPAQCVISPCRIHAVAQTLMVQHYGLGIPPDAQSVLDNPPRPVLSGYASFAHGKVLFAQDSTCTTVYVGSHNFSANAWGLRGSMPKNIEWGVVLLTTTQQCGDEWQSRLPYQLPANGSRSPHTYDIGTLGVHLDENPDLDYIRPWLSG